MYSGLHIYRKRCFKYNASFVFADSFVRLVGCQNICWCAVVVVVVVVVAVLAEAPIQVDRHADPKSLS